MPTSINVCTNDMAKRLTILADRYDVRLRFRNCSRISSLRSFIISSADVFSPTKMATTTHMNR